VFTLRHAVPGETVPRLPGPAAEGGDSEALALGQRGEADPLLGLTGARGQELTEVTGVREQRQRHGPVIAQHPGHMRICCHYCWYLIKFLL